MARHLPDVIELLLMEVPQSEDDLIIQLKSRQESARFAPPENAQMWWQETAETLADELGDPPYDKPWKQMVLGIWTGEAP